MKSTVWNLPTTFPTLTPDQAHVWRIDLSDKNISFIDPSILSVDEQQKANRFHFQKDKNSYSLVRQVLRELLGKYLNTKSTAIEFKYNDKGKPYTGNAAKSIQFNLSHSGKRALIAITVHTEVGVDIECKRDNTDYQKLSQRFFSDNEITAFTELPSTERERCFYNCWTRKESFIKSIGLGLSFPLNKFSVGLENVSNPTLIAINDSRFDSNDFRLHHIQFEDEYTGALCLRGNDLSVQHYHWQPSILEEETN